MNKTLGTILIVLAALILAGGIFFAGSLYFRTNAFGFSMMPGYRWNNVGFGPGMMNGRGYGRNNAGIGQGMMNGRGYGMTLAPGAGTGVGGYGWNNAANPNIQPLTVDQARTAAEKYLSGLNNSDLQIAELMVFNNNAYVAVKEAGTGIGAFELLVDPVSKTVYPEYGPNMMWNQKYGGLNHQNMMGGRGMMAGWNYLNANPANVTATMSITKDQAVKIAQAYLDQNQSGTLAASDPMQFYGYYTLDFSKNGKVVGMLSVNGYSGQVFPHTWHGNFIEETSGQ